MAIKAAIAVSTTKWISHLGNSIRASGLGESRPGYDRNSRARQIRIVNYLSQIVGSAIGPSNSLVRDKDLETSDGPGETFQQFVDRERGRLHTERSNPSAAARA